MTITYTKMQGCGNDFIVIDNQRAQFSASQLSELAKQVCQRKYSIGADALMVLAAPETTGDFRMIFYNADGTEAEMCGNGARCIARYAYEKGLVQAEMVIETVAGNVPAWRLDQRTYKVALNLPTKVELDLDFPDSQLSKVDYIELGNPGIPHLVVHYPDLETTPLDTIKQQARNLRYWNKLPKGANVNFYDFLADGSVILRTYERGVEDFTLACGTGAGSTAYILASKKQQLPKKTTLQVLGGTLQVEAAKNYLYLIGDTVMVSHGQVLDEQLPDSYFNEVLA